MKYYAGIDLGGTKIYSIVIDQNGNILSRSKIKTQANDNFENVLNRIVSCYKDAIKKSGLNEKDIESVGMAVPSAVNIEKGVLIHAPNLKLHNIKLADLMYKKIKKPIFLDNDANMGIFGEYCEGAGRHFHHIFGMFVGTGIGGGYVKDGEVIRGTNYTAGELGHMVIKIDGPKCGCGNNGCLEAVAGKVGMINYMKKLVDKKGNKTLLDEISPQWRESVGASALKKALEKDDYVVKKALQRSAKALGIAAANLINVVGVEAIIFGGGIIEELGDFLTPIIKINMEKYSIADGAKGVKLIHAALGDDSIAFGAAWFVSLPEKNFLLYKGK